MSATPTVLEEDGEETAWLGAAGYHRQGSAEDFYEAPPAGALPPTSGLLPATGSDFPAGPWVTAGLFLLCVGVVLHLARKRVRNQP